MKSFHIEKKIQVFSAREPITFAHKKDLGRENQHTLHLNDHVEIYVYISGDTHYVVEDQYYILEKGDILIIPPYSNHVPILKSQCEYERFYLLFPVSSLSDYVAEPLADFVHLNHSNALSRLCVQKKQQAMDLLYRMSALSLEPASPQTDLLLHALAIEFLCDLSVNHQPSRAVSDGGIIPPLVTDVLSYISISSPEITGLAAIARKFYVSEQHLATVFKRHVGVTVNSYLRSKKIAVAKRMLEEGHSVSFTCYECGFQSCSYFIKVFKEIVGMTPKQYATMTQSKKE